MDIFIKNKLVFSLALLIFSANASALTSNLYDYAINIDGTVSAGTPGSVDPLSLGLDANGLGTMTFTITGAGNHSFSAFFDFDFDEPNNTFFNESATTGNDPAAAQQSWEIDEPGYTFGDIYDNMLDNTLDNTNSVPAGLEDDVAFALGWDFSLADGQIATIMLMLGITDPGIFYLKHTDTEVGPNFDLTESVYYSSTLEISLSPIPVPATVWLFGSALIGLVGFGRRKVTV